NESVTCRSRSRCGVRVTTRRIGSETRARRKRFMEAQQESEDMGTRLYVGNLPFTADDTQIRELFSQSGRSVTEVKLVTDRDTGRPRGFGFVEMGSSQDADGAIRDLNGRDFG